MRATRLVAPEDAPVIAKLITENRGFMAPWEPDRGDDYFTVESQRKVIQAGLERKAQGVSLPHVILDENGEVVGRITLNSIVRGPFQSCSVGYWLSQNANGRGLATAALAEMKRIAFAELGLHRVEAGTLKHNIRSQRVLERNGFERFGLAPRYLKIAGEWQDHILYQVLSGGI
ncbi:MAG: GNAT family N-acetyltransferase [Streptosporangiaceae bacterium]|nr:GNAT family N-acetyltransferase [Streptosporangiaceae bacterium]